jgi:hypothetical protein
VPGTQGWDCRPGYDLATGLGSADGAALVGAWTAGQGSNVDAVIRRPGTGLAVSSGATVPFEGSATGAPGGPLACVWDFGDGGTASGAACAHTYLNPGQLPLTNVVTFTATDSTGASGTDTRAITVLPPPAPGELIVDGGFELGSRAWTGHGVEVGDNLAVVAPHQGSGDAWFPGSRGAGGILQQTVTLPAKAGTAMLTFWLQVFTRETSGQALDAFQVKARGADGRLRILGTYSNLDVGLGYQMHSINLAPCLGQTVQLSFVASDCRSGRTTAFALDDVSLIAR